MFKKTTAMKKTYMIPATFVVRVETAQMVAASAQMYGENATGAALGRRGGNVWDDDEEE